ncbi:MAG: hypothetical protein WCE62_04210, partial [Polyangiales bacterium]
VPTWEVPVVLKSVEWGAKAAEKIGAWLKSEGALAIQILDSYESGDEYYLRFRATNMTMHGIYVCSVRLTWPFDGELKLEVLGQGKRFGFDLPNEVGPAPKSQLVKSGESTVFAVTFRTPTSSERNAGIFKRGLGTATLEYWPLDEAESKTREVKFAIRLDREG